MPTVGVRELKTRATDIIKQVREKGREFIITYRGTPVGLLIPITEDDLEDYILARHPFFADLRSQARTEIENGQFQTEQTLGESLRE
ncbi:MAG: type II toxin-antitoxin system prevent-host-death family antitoxin [Anaerolineae bacterium]